MSTESVLLKRKLETLRSKYQANLRSMDDMRSEYEGSVSLQLKKMQEEMDKKIKENSEKTYVGFEAEFNKFTENLNRQLNEKIEEISSEYDALKKENDEMHKAMLKLEDELTSELRSFSARKNDEENARSSEASRRMEAAYEHFDEFSRQYPHDFFEPSAADALLMQMEATKTDFRSGFYEACMADSSNIEFQISMAEGRIKKQLDQWIRYFSQLESFSVRISELMDSDDFCTVKNERFEKTLNGNDSGAPDTFDFWCENRFSPAITELSEYRSFIESVYSSNGITRQEKITDYLRTQRLNGNSVTFDVLDQMLGKITQLHKTVCTLMMYIHSGFAASFERMADIAPAFVRILSEIRGGRIISKGFRDNDIRNEYILLSEESAKRIYVNIWPVSPDKVNVVNAVGIYVEHTGSGTPENLRATEESLMSLINASFGSSMIIILDSNLGKGSSDTSDSIESIKTRINEKRRKDISVRRTVR